MKIIETRDKTEYIPDAGCKFITKTRSMVVPDTLVIWGSHDSFMNYEMVPEEEALEINNLILKGRERKD